MEKLYNRRKAVSEPFLHPWGHHQLGTQAGQKVRMELLEPRMFLQNQILLVGFAPSAPSSLPVSSWSEFGENSPRVLEIDGI